MLQILSYATVAALVLSMAGYCLERIAAIGRLPRRFAWAAVMAASLALPLTAVLLSDAPSVINQAGMGDQARQHEPGALIATASTPVPGASRDAEADASVTEDLQSSRHIALPVLFASDSAVLIAWAVLSGGALAYLGLAALLLNLQARRWPDLVIQGTHVLVSDSTGPALLGLLRPRIVLPHWILEESEAVQSLVLEHERSHMLARDQWLMRAGILCVALAPWSPALWLQLHRLRLAIELDCDARVMRVGADAKCYGEVLLAVARRAEIAPLGMVAMSEPTSALEQRIGSLDPLPVQRPHVQVTVALLLGIGAVVSACSFDAPSLPTPGVGANSKPSSMPTTPQDRVALSAEDPSDSLALASSDAAGQNRALPVSRDTDLAGGITSAQRREAPRLEDRVLQAAIERHPEVLQHNSPGGSYSVAIKLRADGSVYRSSARFIGESTRPQLDMNLLTSHASTTVSARRISRGERIGDSTLYHDLYIQTTVLPADFDEARSVDLVRDAVLAQHADLMLPASAGIANRVTVLMTDDGKVSRDQVEMGRVQDLSPAGRPEDFEFAALGIGAADVGVYGTTILTVLDEQSDPARLQQAGRRQLFVRYAWPRRDGEESGGRRRTAAPSPVGMSTGASRD